LRERRGLLERRLSPALNERENTQRTEIDARAKDGTLRSMKTPTKSIMLAAAAIAGLMTGCATQKKECTTGSCGVKKGEKAKCGTKADCSSKHTCRGKGNCGAKGACNTKKPS
jgi:hypothetical protein